MSLPIPGTVLADKYLLEALLGEGGMGAVFRARHVLMDTPVALKWLRPDVIDSADARERLLREARAVARIRHPNVVHVYDVDTHDGAPFIVMELLEGESFADLIARESVPIARVIDILIDAMKGLSAAHEHGIVHRDIKPENIFLARDRRHPDGIPKLLDFGVSKTIGNDYGGRITPNGHSVGTPIFMSVEQLTGVDEVDQRTDVYSFGVVLYRALTGTLPFDGDTFASIVIDIATKEIASPKQLRPDLPSSLDHVVMKALARRPEDRYQSIDALIDALRAAEQTFGHTPPSVYASVLTPKPPPMTGLHAGQEGSGDVYYPSGSRRSWSSYAVAAAVCLAVGVLGWAVFSADSSEPHASPAASSEPPSMEEPASPTGAAAPSAGAAQSPSHGAAAPSTASAPVAPAVVGNVPSPARPKAKIVAPPRAAANREPAPKSAPGSKEPASAIGTPAPKRPVLERNLAAPSASTSRKLDAPAPASKAAEPATRPAPVRRTSRSGGLAREDF